MLTIKTPKAITNRRLMRAGTSIAGVIVFLLGLVGLMDVYGRPILPFRLAIVSVYLTTVGTVILFAVIAAIGIGLMIGGAFEGEEKKEEGKLTVDEVKKLGLTEKPA